MRTEVIELEHANDRSVDRQLEQRREPSVVQGNTEQLQGICREALQLCATSPSAHYTPALCSCFARIEECGTGHQSCAALTQLQYRQQGWPAFPQLTYAMTRAGVPVQLHRHGPFRNAASSLTSGGSATASHQTAFHATACGSHAR